MTTMRKNRNKRYIQKKTPLWSMIFKNMKNRSMMCKKNEERETPDDKKYVTEDKTKIWNQKEMITRKYN